MRVAIAADHAGVDLRDQIAHHLRLKGFDVDDLSPENDPDDDYPLIVEPLARAIASGRYERGIFCCGSGIGPAVAANKIVGVRAAVVENEWSARDGVEHVDVNLLTLGERVLGVELAKAIVDSYLGAQPQGGRHERRRKQVEDLEKVKVK